MTPIDWLIDWFDYLSGFGSDQSLALSLSDWLIDQGNTELTVTAIINYCIEHPEEDPTLEVSFSSYPPDDWDGRLLFPTPYTRHSGLDYINYSAEPSVVFDAAYKLNELFTEFYQYSQYYIDDVPIFDIYYYMPEVTINLTSSPRLQRFTYQSLKYESVQQDPPPYTLYFPQFAPNYFFGVGYSFTFVNISIVAECDCCCCGNINEGSPEHMANCEDLVNKLDEILIEFQEIKDEIIEVKEYLTDDFKNDLKAVRSHLNKTQSHLGQRLPHRDFVTASAVDLQDILQKGLGSVSQRVGVVAAVIGGDVIPDDGIPETELTDFNQDLDTIPDADEDPPADGGDGGDDGGDGGGDGN